MCFRFQTVQGRNDEWQGFFRYLRLNLILYREHYENDHLRKLYQCGVCDKKFEDTETLNDHMKSEHIRDPKKLLVPKFLPRLHSNFQCNLCKNTFAKKDNFQRHMLCKHEITNYTRYVTFVCNNCEVFYAKKCCLMVHLKSEFHIKKLKEIGGNK